MTDFCKCNNCGIVIDWEGSDDVHGSIWCCEECGELACEKCIVDKVGYDRFRAMLVGDEKIKCSKCLNKEMEEKTHD